MFKFSTGDLCMIKYAPEAYDELNGWIVKLRQASLNCDVESWYTEEEIPNIIVNIVSQSLSLGCGNSEQKRRKKK